MNDLYVQPVRYRVLWMVAAALLVRLVVVAVVFRSLAAPSIDHQEFGQEVGWIARSLALHQGFSSPFFPQTGPTALLPPLYPLLLSLIFRTFGIYSAGSAFTILALNSLFSALTCIPIYLATRTSLDAKVASLAGWAWVFYPFSIYFSAARVWEYSLTSLLITTCFCIALHLHRRRRLVSWFAFGLLYGLTILSNPAVLSLFPFLLLLAVWKVYQGGGRWARNGVLATFGVLTVLAPWTARNYETFHVLAPVRDDFWDELWAGNNGDTSNPTLGWTHPASGAGEMQQYVQMGEILYVAEKRTLVQDYLRHHPVAFLHLSARRMLCYWTGFWDLAPGYRQAEPLQLPNVFFCTCITLLMLYGICSWWRADRAAAFPYAGLILFFPLAYYVTHPLMDYRQPIEPEIVVLSIVGLQTLIRRRKQSLDAASPYVLDLQPGPLEDAALSKTY